MKNIALIKSIVATSISSANPAELTEHIAALIQAHPEETRENALAILTGTAELTVRPWTDLQQQQLHQPLVHGRAYRKSARRNGLLLYQLHTNRNSLVQDRGRRQCWKEQQLSARRLCHPAREKLRRIYECNIRHPRVEHGQGRVETLTTSIYLGEIRDRFFFFLPKYLNII